MADHDGDLVATYNNPAFLAGIQEGLPITYDKKVATKMILDADGQLSKADLDGFGCRVGYVTNISSSMFAMQELYPEGSEERKEIFNRLKICRRLQGNEIDHQKGIETKPFPEQWARKVKIDEDLEEDEKKRLKFVNSLVVDKRPLFFRFLYTDYEKRYRRELEKFNYYSVIKFGISYLDLLKKQEPTIEESEFISRCRKESFFINSPSVMNNISLYMQSKVKECKLSLKKNGFECEILMDRKSMPFDNDKLCKMLEIFEDYKSYKKSIHQNDCDEPVELNDYLNRLLERGLEISSNIQELATLAVHIVYQKYRNAPKEFAWKIFGEGIVRNIFENSYGDIFVPVASKNGDQEYLWRKYELKKISREYLNEVLDYVE